MIETMRMEKKRILKEDGRYLVYYHFPETADKEETAIFDSIVPASAETEERLAAPSTEAVEGQTHV